MHPLLSEDTTYARTPSILIRLFVCPLLVSSPLTATASPKPLSDTALSEADPRGLESNPCLMIL